MKKLRYSELFYSVQGEGKFVGVPSVFLRTFGCNFRCRAFGRSNVPNDEKINPEVQTIIDNIDNYEKFEDLPLARTGCDTYASIYPKFKRFMKDETIDEVVYNLLDATPLHSWNNTTGQDIHLIITGGEPLLGWQKLYTELLSHSKMIPLRNITFETNGTQPLNDELKYFFNDRAGRLDVTWSISPKLSESGELWRDAIKPEVVKNYITTVGSDAYFKFVISNKEGLHEVKEAVEEYGRYGVSLPVYLMPVGGCMEEYLDNAPLVAEMAMQHGFRFSPREHINLFGNVWGS